MTIIKRINFIFIILGLFSCSPKIRNTMPECYKSEIESEVIYDGDDKNVQLNFANFNSDSKKSIDIIRIISTSGYDSSESFKRVYLEDNKVFIYEKSGLKEATSINSDIFEKEFQNFTKKNILINCKKNSSQQNIYRYFVKVNNTLMMTFTSNDLIKNIDNSLISEELRYFTFFEDIK